MTTPMDNEESVPTSNIILSMKENKFDDNSNVEGHVDAEKIHNEFEIENNEDVQQSDYINEEDYKKPIIEFSFGSLWNWFLPCCLDIWSSSNYNSNPEIIIAYGSRSFLCLADVYPGYATKNKMKKNQIDGTNVKSEQNYEWKIHYRNILNVFGYKSKNFFDVFRSNKNYITTVVFDKTLSMIKYGSGSNKKTNTTNSAILFLGNSDGMAALYDCHQRTSLLQNLPFSSISKSCCRVVTQKKILSAAWLHYQSYGPVVYYALDMYIVVWKVKLNEVKIFHDCEQDCSDSRFNSAQLQIACLASLPAQCSTDKNEHKLAIGYMGGKIVIIGFDSITGKQTSLFIFTESSHNDDICSLSFSSYSLSNHSVYQNGLLCSVSRDSVLKIWSCSHVNKIAEYRIPNSGPQGSNSRASATNWFTALFLPRPNVSPNAAYEIVFSNSNGDLLTFTLPDKNLNSQLRIGKTYKTFQSKKKNNEVINHSFIIFSIATNLELQIAITISLDYKLILWDLSKRISCDVFHTSSNGALSIDTCRTDKRVAIAFGNNIFVLDFVLNQPNDNDNGVDTMYNVNVQRLALSSKNTKFFNVIWNCKFFERSGRLIVGTSYGELYHYDLNSKSIVYKLNKSSCQDHSKIYDMIWMDYLLPENNDDPVVLTLHQSGNIVVNHLEGNPSQENLDKYLIGLPDQKVKRTALASFSENERLYLIMGNYDGTLDVFYRFKQNEQYQGKAFKHMYRFRAFNRPCVSIGYCSITNWLSVTALHENCINCYYLALYDPNDDNNNGSSTESELINVKLLSTKCRLTGHEDRVSFTCWSPFNDEKRILLASSSYDSTCIIWDVINKTALRRFFGHKSVVYTIRWCHFNADYLFSGSEDNFFFWNWTIQPTCSSTDSKMTDKIKHKIDVKIGSLMSLMSKKQKTEDDNEITINDTLETSLDTLEVNKSNKNKIKTPTIKALFPISNQIENNSSKYDILDDIKWLITLKRQQKGESNVVPQNKLDRILLYGGEYDHIERLLKLEIDFHNKNDNTDGQYMLSLFLNTRKCITKSIEKNECDPILTMFASGLSKQLFNDCIENILGDATKNRPLSLVPKIKWNNYNKELSALMRLCCLNDFQGAIDSLIANNLYREAIIISIINLASSTFVSNLMYRWHKYRIQQNNYEGAIKCLIACKDYEQALELLELRRTLCSDTSSNSILKQYDDVIEFLKF